MDIDNKSSQNNLVPYRAIPRLSLDAVKNFQSLYLKEYKKEVSSEEAERLGMILLRLFSVIYRPIRKEGYGK